MGLLCYVQSSIAAISHDSTLKWQTLHSTNFEVHFHTGEQLLAERTINIAEELLAELETTLQWQVSDIIEIVLSDEQDLANGSLFPLLTHLRIAISAAAPTDNFIDYSNWLALLIKHELTHALHLDMAVGNPASFKNIFGRHPLLFPNLFQPLWLIEGYATYRETDFKKGVGRGQSSIFQMMMRVEVENGLKPLNQVNLAISRWPSGITRYLYGYYFYEFLESRYSNASIVRLIAQYSENLVPYRLNNTSELTYGKTYHELWQDFKHYLENKFSTEIDEIKSQEIINGKQITSTGYLKLYAQPLDNGNLLYSEDNAIQPPHLLLKKFNINRTEFITEVQAKSQFDAHPESGILVSQIEIYRNTNSFYDLFQVDLNNKHLKRLTRGDRFHNAIWSPDGKKILAIYNKLGQHSLVLLNKDGRLVDLLWEGLPGEYISSMDWSPDNRNIVASVKRNNSSWNLEKFNFAQRSWKNITQNNAIEIQPQYSSDGRSIYFSADYNGIFNIRQLDIKSGKIRTLTRVMGGAFSPRTNRKGDLFYIGYSAKGYDIFQLDNTGPPESTTDFIMLKTGNSQPNSFTSSNHPPPKVDFELSDYSALEHLKPSWWTPTLSATQESIMMGAYTSGSDALNRHAYDAYLAFDFRSTSLSGEFNYSYDRWFPLLQTHIESNKKQDHRNDTYQFEILAPLISRITKMYLGVDFIYEKNSDTIKQKNGSKTTIKNSSPILGVGAIYDSRRRQRLSISPSFGRLVSLTVETSDFFGDTFNGQMFIAKWSEYINLKPQHVLALRFIGGFGLSNPRPFQLGGSIGDSEFENASIRSAYLSTLPPRTSLYNKRRYALRGYPSNAASLRGRRMLMYNIEWRFPLTTIERSLSMFPLGLHKISSTIFAENGSTWNSGATPQNNHYSIGSEIHFHTEIFNFVPVRIRLGYAYGIHKDGQHQIYAQLGSSF